MKFIGKYEVLGRLGRGGMATVYKARAPFTMRIVAIKVLRPRDEIFIDLVGWDGLCKAFLDEARLMAEMQHFSIAQVVDYGEHEGAPFVVLEYYSHSVGAVIGEGYQVEADSRVLGEKSVAHYLRSCLQGLIRLHSSGIVHRDIKPYNLMLTNDDNVKIIDFGLSKVRGEEMMNVPGMQVGSPYYTAPELRKDPDSADARADLYSLAVMAYRMLTGKLYSGKSGPQKELLKEHWVDFITCGLEKDPDARFASAETMLVALETLVEKMHPKEECGKCSSLFFPTQPRSTPKRILYKDIREQLQLDELFQPLQFFGRTMKVQDDFVVEDVGNHRLWQRRGAGYCMTWEEASLYVEGLNKSCWAGRNNWRIPTIEELMTILCLGRTGDSRCHNKIFLEEIKWLWSADQSTKKQAWLVDFSEGYVDRLDRDGAASLCAVSSLQE